MKRGAELTGEDIVHVTARVTPCFCPANTPFERRETMRQKERKEDVPRCDETTLNIELISQEEK